MAANTAAGLRPSPEQLQAQLELWQSEQLSRVFDAMQYVAAPEHAQLGFAVASDVSASLARRKSGLLLLDRTLSPTDVAALTRREAIRRDLTTAEHAAEAASHDDVHVVAGMRAALRRCFQEQLGRQQGDHSGAAKFKVLASGDPADLEVTGFPIEMAACVEAVVRGSRFARSAESRVIRVPLTFVAQHSDAVPTSADCLKYEPEEVELTGTLERRDFAGPPNYESIANGDAKETTWLLRLDRLLCTQNGSDALQPARLGIDVVQLVFGVDAHAYDRYRGLMGQRIAARGSLFGAQTGHHHTDVLLTVTALAPAR